MVVQEPIYREANQETHLCMVIEELKEYYLPQILEMVPPPGQKTTVSFQLGGKVPTYVCKGGKYPRLEESHAQNAGQHLGKCLGPMQ
eukprot:172712-Amphidinium_carterae.1